MNETKRWYTSKTVWAGAIGIAASLVGLVLHVTVTADQVQALAGDATAIATAAAGAAAIYGRIKATHKIAPTKSAP